MFTALGEISVPRDICRGIVVSLAAASPESLVDGDSISSVSANTNVFHAMLLRLKLRIQLCHLLADPSLDVQITTYDLLHHASKPYTENVVLEAEVDTGSEVKPSLPAELMQLVQAYNGEADEVKQSIITIGGATLLMNACEEFTASSSRMDGRL